MKPDLLSISMFPTVSLDIEDKIRNLLEIFEANEKMIPTYWGNSDGVKVEYNRNEIIEKVIAKDKISELYLYRDKAAKYSGVFDIKWSQRSFLKIDFHKPISPKLLASFYDFSDKIAQLVKPIYGVAHIFWPSTYPWNNERERMQVWMDVCAYPVPVRFFPNGPLGIGARTYFSGHLLEMFGKEFLLDCPGEVTEPDWGGIRIDVLPSFLTSDNDTLLESWLSIMKYLQTSQVLAIPSFDEDKMGVSFSPNTAWKEYLNKS
ncbi:MULTISPECIES: hypothetical protein [Paenibacillus]|uniref:DUF3396 domain-containing protein n=1 Tax=Paenibacillus campinasensis TaxID=66347 RepID=A0A268EDJ1_9BACL|nr:MULTISPECIES: hypothetical protein [Paenibacillus]MUG69028.1 hypothetical protein [Paenibacillus campinasensis]PAD71160.1 hypothetical protein CHH67_25610 [Paenibacillus campinasensis]PAK47394.1 hypothetical protein CHH75_24345 [Paenibacillus sp. 7541]